jgi:diaminopimelate epimerase
MNRIIEVFRMSGAGNLFSVIDNNRHRFNDIQLFELAVKLCSINDINDFATEGLLALSTDSEFDFDVKFLNPDGSTGMMCGNGGRCAVDFADSKMYVNRAEEIYHFKMAGNEYYGEVADDGIRLTLPTPVLIEQNKSIKIDGKVITGTYINVASDHFVVDFNDLAEHPVEFNKDSINDFAPNIRNHTDFGFAGVNVNIYKKAGDVVYLMTYERGVERVTGACGTGAVSTAVHLYYSGFKQLPVIIMPPSSIPVFIDFKFDYSGKIKSIYLTGHSEIIRKDIVTINI